MPLRILAFALSIVLAAAPLCGAAAAGQRALLTMRVNTIEKGDVAVVVENADVLVPAAFLKQAGITGIDFDKAADGEGMVPLSKLKNDLTFRVDEKSLTLDISVAPDHLPTTLIDYTLKPSLTIGTPAKSAFLNYGIGASTGSGLTTAAEAGTRIGAGVYRTTFAASGSTRQLQSQWVFDDVRGGRRITAGDTYASTGDLGATMFLSGISVQRDFGLTPQTARSILPGIHGEVSTPSTADIYINGTLFRHETLAPGQFVLADLPVGTGPNDTRVVVTDAFGRQRTYANDFYGAETLLAPHVSDFTYAAGVPRSIFGSSERKGLAALGRYETGLTENVTASARLETGRALTSGGAEVLLRAHRGIVGVSGALSRSQGDTGAAAILSYQSNAARLTYGATVGLQSAHYATLSLGADGDRPLLSASASIAAAAGRNSSVGLSFSLQRDRDNGQQSLLQLSRWTTISRSLTVQFSAQRTHSAAGSAFGISTALNLLPRSGTNASLTASSSGGLTQTTLQVSHMVSSQTPAFGYDAAFSAGGASPSLYASADYRNTTGDYTADASFAGGSRSLAFNAAGGIVTFGHRAFFTQSVDDSYALVDANGLAGVRVMANNVEAGRTGPSGFLVVPRLGSYFDNTISLASSDIPMNYSIDRAVQHVTPSYRSGQIVRFTNERVHALSGRLVVRNTARESIPAYGLLEVRLNAGAVARSDIGQNGEFYLENIAPGTYEATVRYREGDCTFHLTVPVGDAVIEKLPVQICSLEVRH